MKSLFRKIGLASIAVMPFSGAIAGSVQRTSVSEEVLKDVAQATNDAGELPGFAAVPVILSSDEMIATQTPEGIDLAVLPGEVIQTPMGTIVKGEGQSNVVFQQVASGSYRALIHIASPSDPEHYDFTVIGVERLDAQSDGSVQAFNSDGELVARIEMPWAKDRDGRDVPTRYEIDQTTLRQIVEHRSSGFSYGITADPLMTVAAIAAGVTGLGTIIAATLSAGGCLCDGGGSDDRECTGRAVAHAAHQNERSMAGQ